MELADLNQDERVALVALIKSVALADRAVSDEEQDSLADVVDELGEDSYRAAMDTSDAKFASEADLKTFLHTITRQEAREIIYGTVFDLALSDSVASDESPLLDWVAKTWKVEATFEGVPDGGAGGED